MDTSCNIIENEFNGILKLIKKKKTFLLFWNYLTLCCFIFHYLCFWYFINNVCTYQTESCVLSLLISQQHITASAETSFSHPSEKCLPSSDSTECFELIECITKQSLIFLWRPKHWIISNLIRCIPEKKWGSWSV